MLPCIDPEWSKYLAASGCKDELIERIRNVLQRMDSRCFRDLSVEIGVSYSSIYQFNTRLVNEPSLKTVDKLIRYLVPGYELGLIPEHAPAACPVVFVPPDGWKVHPDNPAYYYKGQEVLTEAQLRAKFAPKIAAE